MRATGIPEGTMAVWNMNTQNFDTRPAGEPDENQELWVVEDGLWQPCREVTRKEQAKLNIVAFLEAAIDEVERL